jgi:hypothetical protein
MHHQTMNMSPSDGPSKTFSDNGHRYSKMGRKGDPRMNRAVAARLTNPKLSLLDALIAGGFSFPSDTSNVLDSDLLDNDGVSLAQRKNQLSRRLRIVRQGHHHQQHHQPKRHDGEEKESTNSAMTPDDDQTELEQSFEQHPVAFMQSSSAPNRPLKRSADAALGTEKRETQDEDYEVEMAIMQNRLAKFHPQYHPLFPSLVHTSHSALPTNHTHNNTAVPDVARVSVAAANLGAPSATAATASTSTTVPDGVSSSTLNDLLSKQQQLLSTATQHHPSGVAIASLTHTAASVGLTLDQLAMSLSTTPNLLRVLASNPSLEQKQELALKLYHIECGAAMQKCMLLAGYGTLDAYNKNSDQRRQLAIRAWQLEGRRLEKALSGGSSRANNTATAMATSVASATSTNASVAQATCQTPQQTQVQTQSQQLPAEPTSQQQQKLLGVGESTALSAAPTTSNPIDDLEQHTQCTEDGQHMHSITGSCGHKPVIHQPEGRPAHIDFVVGSKGKLECYEGIAPSRNVERDTAIWPSRYKCADLVQPEASKVGMNAY